MPFLRPLYVSVLLFATLAMQASESPVLGTWTGSLISTMRNDDLSPKTQFLKSPVTLVISQINIGNPDQDGKYQAGFYIWNGLPIGGPPENGFLSTAGMNMPAPAGTRFGASVSTSNALITMTLVGKVTDGYLEATGQFLTPWAFHTFTVRARRYLGAVDESGLPLPALPRGLSQLEDIFRWRPVIDGNSALPIGPEAPLRG